MTDTLYRLPERLEWVPKPGFEDTWFVARTPWGEYGVIKEGPPSRPWYTTGTPYCDYGFHATLEAAQSAALAHYRARMAEGLVPVKVLGELPMTADGCVIGLGAVLYGRGVDRISETCLLTKDDELEAERVGIEVGLDPLCVGPKQARVPRLFSTRAAAEAAKKEPTS